MTVTLKPWNSDVNEDWSWVCEKSDKLSLIIVTLERRAAIIAVKLVVRRQVTAGPSWTEKHGNDSALNDAMCPDPASTVLMELACVLKHNCIKAIVE